MRNRLFRKVISVLLIFSIIVTMLPRNIFAERNEFSDVHSHKDEIYTLVDLGIIHGFTDNTFRPYTSITRGQGIAMIIREMGVSTDNRKDPGFKDVHKRNSFYKEIATAKELGIIAGKGDGTYGVNEEMTRAQMARILVNAYDLKLIESNNKSFKDVSSSHWAHTYISILASNGITLGYGDGTFRPQEKLTRVQFSLFLYRYIDEVKGQTPQPGEVLTNGENKTVLLEDTILIDEDLESSIDIKEKDEDEYEITFSESIDIEKGDVFVLPATDEFPGGLAAKAEKVTEKNNQVIIETSQPEIDEVFYSIQGSSEVTLQPENFIPAPGVEVIESQAKVNHDFEINPNIKVNLNKLNAGKIKLDSSLLLRGKLKGEIEWGVLTGVDSFDFNVELGQELELGVEIEDDIEYTEQIGMWRIPTSIPLITFDLPISLVIGCEGTIKLVGGTASLEEEIGVKYDDRNGLSTYPEDKFRANMKRSGFDMSGGFFFGVDIPVDLAIATIDLIGLSNEPGISFEGSPEKYGKGGNLVSLKVEGSTYLKERITIPILKKKLDPRSFEIKFDEFYLYPITSVELIPNTLEIAPEESTQLSVKAYNKLGEDDIAEEEDFVKYKSSNDSIIKVSKDGLVKATSNAKDGDTATITVTVDQGWETLTDTVEVKVVDQLESGTLTGKVVDAVTSMPIKGARIYIFDKKQLVKELETAEDGSYEVNLMPRKYTIGFQKQGYKPSTGNVEIIEANTVVHDVKLELVENQLPDNDESDSEQGDGFNQGAGYEQGAYDKLALYPTRINWSGQSRFLGPKNPTSLKSIIKLGSTSSKSQLNYVIGADGTIYYSNSNDLLYAVGSDGVKRWELEINARSLVMGENGVIYAVDDTTLYAIHSSGKIKWECKIANSRYGFGPYIMIGADGSIYLYHGYHFYKVTPNGEIQWKVLFNISSTVAPVLAKDGNIYTVSNSGSTTMIYRINSETGESNKIYTYYPDSAFDISAEDFKVGEDGTFYITNNYVNNPATYTINSELLAISQNGEKKWILSLNAGQVGGLAISKDGTIYVNTWNKLFAITSDGKIKWEREGGGSIEHNEDGELLNSPVIGMDGVVYNIGDTAYYAFSPEDGSVKWQLPHSNNSNHLFLGGNGLLYTTEYKNNHLYFSVIKDGE